MSVHNSVAQKSLTESKIVEEENEISVGDIKLPPGERGESPVGCDLKQIHVDRTNDEDEKNPLDITGPEPFPVKQGEIGIASLCKVSNTKVCNSPHSMESHLGLISEICLPDSPSSSHKSNSSSLSGHQRESTPTPLKNDRPLNKSPSPYQNKESPVCESSVSNLMYCTSPGIMQSPFDIPLPNQSLEESPTLPKSHTSDISTIENQNSPSVKANNFDLNMNSANSSLGIESNETVDTSENVIANLDSKNFSCLLEISEEAGIVDPNLKKNFDDSRYSPSRLDSEEETQEFAAIKPKVLGKEQAKKRLMAFSLSKQSNTSVVKKQNILAVSQKLGKEKPPNPNKSGCVQDQFRATISAIEEEKKRMLQNMPNYLFSYSNNLSNVGDTVIPNPSQGIEKTGKEVNDGSDTSIKAATEKDEKDGKKVKHGQQSPNRSKNLRHRRRSSSSSSSKKSGSRSRKYAKESDKTKDNNSQISKMETMQDWKSFAESGFELDSNFRRLKLRFEEDKRKNKLKPQKRVWTSDYKSINEYKPIFNYLKKNSKLMVPLQARGIKSGMTVSFQEKTVKYTRTKPVINWAENPNHATDFYMPKQLLLENCDKNVSSTLHFIMEQKGEKYIEMRKPKEKFWYPQIDYLIEIEKPEDFDVYDEKDESSTLNRQGRATKEDNSKGNTCEKDGSRTNDTKPELSKNDSTVGGVGENFPVGPEGERRLNSVNDDYLSGVGKDEVPVKEVVVGDVKVKLDLELNSVRVRSKWDSDYDGEDNEKNMFLNKIKKPENKEGDVPEPQRGKEKPVGDVEIPSDMSVEFPFNQNCVPRVQEPQPQDFSLDEPKGKLASEYEEFMKMVTLKAGDGSEVSSDKVNANPTVSAIDLIVNDSKAIKNINPTDWDLESDHEEKPYATKIDYFKEDATDNFSLLLPKYKIKKRVKLKSPLKKKSGKFKVKDKFKKFNKNKKKKRRDSSSESSSSVSSNSRSVSDSDPDSDTSDSENERRKRKKRKIKKSKKRYSSSSSASSSSSSSSSSSTSSSSSSTSSSSSSSSLNNSDSKLSKSQKTKAKKKKNKNSKIIGADDMDSDHLSRGDVFKQLDIDKEQLMKKIEEIDAVGSKISKKKESSKSSKGIDDESSKSEESENDLNVEKGNKVHVKSPGKFEKGKVISKDDEEKAISQKVSEKFDDRLSESENTSPRGKKVRKKSKKHESSSETSSDEGIEEEREEKSIQNFTADKTKSRDYSYGSESESDSDSRKLKKKLRKKKRKKKKNGEQKLSTKTAHEEIGDWNDHLLSDGPDFRTGNSGVNDAMSWLNDRIEYYRKLKEVDILLGKNSREHKDLGDWEKSSGEESPKIRVSRESTWDEELPPSSFSELSKDGSQKAHHKSTFSREHREHRDNRDNKNKFLNDFDLETKHDFIFNENSAGSVKHDVCSLENSTSIQFFPSLKGRSPNLSADYQSKRNFHGIGEELKQNLHKATSDELYSPGHSDSDASDIIEKKNGQRKSGKSVRTKEEIYDPLNSDSDASSNGNNKLEPNTIPLPSSTDISLPEVNKELEEEKSSVTASSSESSKPKADFIAVPFAKENDDKNRYFKSASDKSGMSNTNVTKKPMISVKLQQKFQCKVASVFQNDSEDEEVGKTLKKGKIGEHETGLEEKVPDKPVAKKEKPDNKKKTEDTKLRDKSRSRSTEREHKSRSSYDNYKENDPGRFRRRSRTPESKQSDSDSRMGGDKDKSDYKNVQFNSESESKKSAETPDSDVVRPIPVLTGLDIRMSGNHHWGRSLGSEDIGYSCDRFDLMDPTHLDSYKLYGSHDAKSNEADLYNSVDKRYPGSRYDRNFGKDFDCPPLDVLLENRSRKEKRKSRSRSSSPRKKRRSKTPDRRRSPRNRSPKHRSTSPRRRGRSPFSPRRRSSPRSRRYKSSRSPDRRKSKSPRKRNSRRSRSASPKKPRMRMDSPRRRSLSPGKDGCREIGVRNLIHLAGIGNDENEMDLNSLVPKSSKYDSPMGFTRSLADSTISDSELSNTFYARDYPSEYGAPNYPEEVTVNNLITLQNHDADKQTDSPKRLTLDQRIEIELGVPPLQNDQYQVPPQPYPQFPEPTNQYSNSYTCDDTLPHSNSNGNQNFYPSQNQDFNGQFFNGQQPLSNFGEFHQFPRHNAPPLQNSVLQVGNIMEVVPTLQAPPPPLPHSQGHQIMQVGNVLQVVPSPKPTQGDSYGYGVPPPSPGNLQKSAPVLPQNNVPNPETLMNPLLKAIQLEREKRKKDREKRRQEREARRKARQLKREAKLLSVNEKLKKSVQDEGLMLGQEVEEDELLEEIEHPSPPVPVEIVTDSSHNSLPPAGKGILITAGFIQKPASEKKEVKFADGICPGEGTSTSGGEDRASPPPKPKLPKEKRYKKRKKKTKLKKKVKVRIIRQVIQDDENDDDDDDDDDDNLSPPPPPPGDPPPVFFARFPFGVKAQYPVYQIQTTNTALITVQFPGKSYQ